MTEDQKTLVPERREEKVVYEYNGKHERPDKRWYPVVKITSIKSNNNFCTYKYTREKRGCHVGYEIRNITFEGPDNMTEKELLNKLEEILDNDPKEIRRRLNEL